MDLALIMNAVIRDFDDEVEVEIKLGRYFFKKKGLRHQIN